MNMFDPSDLFEDEEMQRIEDDLRTECERFGPVNQIKIPRPSQIDQTEHREIEVEQKVDQLEQLYAVTPGIGKIFVRFEHLKDAKIARFRLSGRQYNGKTLVASFYPCHYFDIGEFG